jgi:outer membrane protein insertion porin family
MLFANISLADNLKKINIDGNQRITNETIIVFSNIKLDQNINDQVLNKILKSLYETNFFKDVKIKFDNGILNIKVEENPIVQTIKINGIKAKKIKDVILDNLVLKEKQSFIPSTAKNDITLVKNSLKQIGYYFVTVELSEVKNDNNTIDLVYDINLGKKASISSIKFIGDKKIKDRKLRNIITTEEDKFWKFVSNRKYLDQSRLNLDVRLLNNFYKNKGFYSVDIKSTFASFKDKNNFELIFNINAGNKFFFNELSLELPDNYDRQNFNDIQKILDKLQDSLYSLRKIELILKEIDKIIATTQYEFINASIDERIIEDNKLNIKIIVEDSQKFYVERIDILGNNITNDNVIRNSLIVDEGDPYNELSFNKSINNLKNLNIFANIQSEIVEGSEDKLKVVNISVEEKSTGEISAGAGYGTSGSSIGFSVNENNFLGKGVRLSTDLAFSHDHLRGLVHINTPNFRYSDKSLSTTFERSSIDKSIDFGYKSEKTGVALGTYFEQYSDTFFSPKVALYLESLETDLTASTKLKKQEGDYFDTIFSYGIDYDKRNQTYQPTDGFISSFDQSIPLISEDYIITNAYTFTKYKELSEGTIASLSFFTKATNSLSGDDVRISERLFLPPRKLRGFQAGKLGPKDKDDYIGGNYASAINLAISLPKLLPDAQNIDFAVFFDAGNIWGVDYDDALDDGGSIRSAAGIAIDFYTPIGPLNFSFAEAITSKKSDITEFFRFNLGTTF